MSTCIFCEIVAERSPSLPLGGDERVVAFLDIAPLTPGHSLIVPRAHSDDVTGTDPDDLSAMMGMAQRLAPHICSTLGATGFHLMMNTGADALQTVFHTHLHIIPRSPGDGFGVKLAQRGASHEELVAVHRQLVPVTEA